MKDLMIISVKNFIWGDNDALRYREHGYSSMKEFRCVKST
jgi:hypothetical protein